jgi:hypothetical protein
MAVFSYVSEFPQVIQMLASDTDRRTRHHFHRLTASVAPVRLR